MGANANGAARLATAGADTTRYAGHEQSREYPTIAVALIIEYTLRPKVATSNTSPCAYQRS